MTDCFSFSLRFIVSNSNTATVVVKAEYTIHKKCFKKRKTYPTVADAVDMLLSEIHKIINNIALANKSTYHIIVNKYHNNNTLFPIRYPTYTLFGN